MAGWGAVRERACVRPEGPGPGPAGYFGAETGRPSCSLTFLCPRPQGGGQAAGVVANLSLDSGYKKHRCHMQMFQHAREIRNLICFF